MKRKKMLKEKENKTNQNEWYKQTEKSAVKKIKENIKLNKKK